MTLSLAATIYLGAYPEMLKKKGGEGGFGIRLDLCTKGMQGPRRESINIDGGLIH